MKRKIFYFCIFLLFTITSCSNNKPTFTLSKDVIEIPFIYDFKDAFYYSNIIYNGDTIKVGIDTGFSRSSLKFPKGRKQKRTQTTDARGITKILDVVKVNKIKWGGLTIKNLDIINASNIFRNNLLKNLDASNIIGCDILKNFCVKFDNDNNKILLSSNSDLIDKKGIKIPFEFKNQIIFTSKINNKDTKLFLDTGYSGEIELDSSSFYNCKLFKNSLKWNKIPLKSTFLPDTYNVNDTVYYALANCKLQNKTFANTMITYCVNTNNQKDVITKVGFSFMRRFKSFTIDFPNKYLYFELFNHNLKTKDIDLIFTDSIIKPVTIEYIDDFFKYYNSLGINVDLTEDTTFFVHGILLDSLNSNTKIEPRDTIIGVNEYIFYKNIFNKMPNKSKYKLELSKYQRKEIILVNIYRQNNVIFHILKNGKVYTIDTKRKEYIKNPPYIAYAYYFDSDVISYLSEINLYINKRKDTNMTIHFPCEFLSHKNITIPGIDDNSKKVMLSNKSKIKLR